MFATLAVMPPPGRAPNIAVRDNFARVPDPSKKSDIGICKHCHWRRAWQSTNLQKHLNECARYQDFVDSGEPEDELDQRSQDAFAVMLEILAQQPAVPPVERTARQVGRQQPHVTVERLPPQNSGQLAFQAQPNERERMMEAVLGMVWSALAATGSPESAPNTALWNLVNTVAPNALKHSQAAPRHAGLPGQYNTPNYGTYTPNRGASGAGGAEGASRGARSDSTYLSG